MGYQFLYDFMKELYQKLSVYVDAIYTYFLIFAVSINPVSIRSKIGLDHFLNSKFKCVIRGYSHFPLFMKQNNKICVCTIKTTLYIYIYIHIATASKLNYKVRKNYNTQYIILHKG